MKKQLFSTTILLPALCLSSGVLLADEQGQSGIFGQIRGGYVNLDDNAGSKTDTLSIGGKLGYKTKKYNGLSAGATFYTSNPLGGVDDEGLFLDSNGNGYSILGEAYVNADLGKTSIKLGRQEIDTPFADTDDIGMVPNTFEGLVVSNSSLSNTKLYGMHLSRWAGVDAPVPEKFTKMNDDDGINAIGAVYEPSDKLNVQGWHYNAKNGTDISYIEAGFTPLESLELGAQYATQDGAGFDGKVWGLSASYGIGDITLSTAYNKVSDGQVTNGFGGGPFFTSAEDHTIAEADNQEATTFGIEYTGINKLTLAATQVNFDQGADELDLVASYEINDNLSADLIYSDMNDDGTLTRAFINYNF